MKTISIFLISVLITINSYPQINYPTKIAEKERFDCNNSSFREFMEKGLKYPPDAILYKIHGVLLAGIQIMPSGEINRVYLLNSLYPSIDNMVLNLLESTANCWKPLPDSVKSINQNFVIPIIIKFEGMDIELNKEFKPEILLDEINLTVIGIIRGTEEHEITELESIDKIIMRTEKDLKKKKYEKVLESSNELLKRDPINPNYYLYRINAFIGLDEMNSACQDYKFVRQFLKYDYKDKLELICQ